MRSKSFLSGAGLAVLSVLSLGGCPTRDIAQLDTSPAVEISKPIQVKTNRQVDILFVVDNSDSMQQEQDSLNRNFPKFIEVLQGIQGGLPDVHIGVVSSSVGVGDNVGLAQCGNTLIDENGHGLLQNQPRPPSGQTCTAMNPPDRFISDVTAPGSDGGMRITNYSGSLADTFKCVANLGTKGCGFEQHLESMWEALDGSNPENAGFLRDDAYLAVIILADEDDCSAKDTHIFDPSDSQVPFYGPLTSFRCTEWGVSCDDTTIQRVPADYTTCVPRGDSPYLNHPQVYFDKLKMLKRDPSLLIGAVIAGVPSPFGVTLDDMANPALKPSCTSTNGRADPGVRLKYFADQFGRNGTFVSICQDNLDVALTRVAQLLAKVISTPCLDAAVDVTDIDPNAPGLQVQCQVSDVKSAGTASQTETVLPRCAMTDATTPVRTTLPCWWTAIDPATCPDNISTTHLVLHVERAADTVDVTELARCVTKD